MGRFHEAGDVCGIVVEDVVPLRQRDRACVDRPISTVDLNVRGRDAAPGVVRREAHDDIRHVPSVRPGGPRDRRGRRGWGPVDGHRGGMHRFHEAGLVGGEVVDRVQPVAQDERTIIG